MSDTVPLVVWLWDQRCCLLAMLLNFIWRNRLSAVPPVDLAEVESCEWCYHLNYVWVLHISHDLNFLQVSMLIMLVCKFLFLQRDWFYCIKIAIAAASDLTDDAEGSPTQQFYYFEVLRCQVCAVHYSNGVLLSGFGLLLAISQTRVTTAYYGAILSRDGGRLHLFLRLIVIFFIKLFKLLFYL